MEKLKTKWATHKGTEIRKPVSMNDTNNIKNNKAKYSKLPIIQMHE